MKKEIKKLFKFKLLWVFLLIMLWIFLTVWYVVTFDTSFSIWSYNHQNSNIKNLNYNLFYKGEIFKGELIAQDNNLGIVTIRFQTYVRPPYQYEDKYLFRIKEKGSNKWYYENTYRNGLVYDIPFLPFGFPQIADSKGKSYQFELTTLNTNSVNKLSISRRYPVLQTKYKYSGKELLKNPSDFLKFLSIKFTNAFKTPDVIFSSFIYLMPLLFYLGWIYFPQNRFIKKMNYFIIIIALIDVLIIQLSNDVVYIALSALWIFTLSKYKKDSKSSFVVGLVLITLCPLLLFINAQPTAEKSSAWAFMFLLAGTIQIFLKEGKNPSK